MLRAQVGELGVRGCGTTLSSSAARSACTAARTAAGARRNAASAGSSRSCSGAKPSTASARAFEACAWSEAYTTASGAGRPPSRAVRAAASAVIVPVEPPVTSTPSLSGGSPHSARSQSMTTSSTVAAPAPPAHEPVNTLNPAAAASASTPA